MQSKEKIKEQIDILERLDKVMPQFSLFGTNNHEAHLIQIEALETMLEHNAIDCDVEELLDERYDELDSLGEGSGSDPLVRAYQWFLDGDEADPLAEESDVKLFAAKKKREGK